MADRNVYHVVPADDAWGVRLEGAPTLATQADTQDAAVERASGYVRQLGAGRVVVHGEGGQIEAVHTFDQLPAAHPGRGPTWRSTTRSPWPPASRPWSRWRSPCAAGRRSPSSGNAPFVTRSRRR